MSTNNGVTRSPIFLFLAIFLAGFTLLLFQHYYFIHLINQLDQRSENERNRMAIGQLVTKELKQIEADFFKLPTSTDLRVRQLIQEKIQQDITKIREALIVLENGGSLDLVIPLNLPDKNEMLASVRYQPTSGERYNLEIIELRPMLVELEEYANTIAVKAGIRDQNRKIGDTEAWLHSIKQIKSYLKTIFPFLIRINEQANRGLYDSQLSLLSLETEIAQEKRRYVFLEIVLTIFIVFFVLAWVALVSRHLSRAQHKVQEKIAELQESKQALAQAHDRFKHLAYYDSITGLPNRSHLIERLDAAIEGAKRFQRELAIIFIDLDGFKKINDSLGHDAGDELLAMVAERLKNTMRKSDFLFHTAIDPNIVARFGGDEFVILLSEIRKGSDAAKVAERIIKTMQKPVFIQSQEIHVSLSMGIGLYPADGSSSGSLLKNADTAMYHAKSESRNSFMYYSKPMNEEALDMLVMENNLRKAFEAEEFVLHYQPKIRLIDGVIVGAEALIRWHQKDEGLIPPEKFIPIVEHNGQIIHIGKWVIEEACRQHRIWKDAGLPPLKIAVNVSARQFLEPNFISTVQEAIDTSGINPRFLEVEVTESVIMNDVRKRIENLYELKKIGVSIAIDDFGTGYSSLNYLAQFPLDTLKIDRSFVMNISKLSERVSVTTAIIALAKQLKLNIVAEGVETQEQMNFLIEYGCNEAQGFLFSKPLAADKMQALLQGGSQQSVSGNWQHLYTPDLDGFQKHTRWNLRN